MLGAANLTAYVNEGAKARKDGKANWENPYSYMTETLAAYAWDEGYKRGQK